MKTIKNLTADELRKSILQLAIQGKLVKQNPNDEPASELVKKIYEEKKKLIAEGKIKKDKNESYIFKDDDNCYYEKTGNKAPAKVEDLPFDIPENWTWIRLKHVSFLNGGFAFKSDKFSKEGIRVIRISDFDENGIKSKNIKRYPYEPALEQYEIKCGDILLCMTGGTVGKSTFIHEIDEPSYINQRVALIRINKINTAYFYTVLSSPYLVDVIKSNKTSTNDNISMGLIEDFLIPLPPLIEQQRIVEKINFLEPLIQDYDKYEKQLTELESSFVDKLKKSILQYAIEGKLVKQDQNDEPASVLLERIKAEKEALIKTGKIKRDKNESYIFQGDDKNYYENIPKCWDLIRFDVFTIYTSDYVANGSFKSLKENVNFYKIPNYALLVKTQDFSNNFTYDLTYTDKHGYEFLQKCHLYGGELIMSNIGASIGKIMIMPQLNLKCALAPNSILVKCFDTVTTKYLQLFMSSYYGQNILKEFTAGTAMPKFSKTQIRQTIIPVPPYNEQQRIVNKIELINKAID